ncbi:double-strand break repair protein MRE11-like [Ornithodoros turicata]|uniref:double-strand break repair protein MRE11-like n=1 Tax=Ornithodoros turicata TaxID=34597 RepID=UPI003139CAE5
MKMISEADTFKILVASDIHLGYEAQESIRKDDSLTTFREILEIAVSNSVDFILLGGDLFHENHPPRWVEHEALRLLRQYCLGSKPIHFEFLSDQSENFSFCSFPNVNYEDPNLNVSYPVFTVHGNHDDPSGAENLSCIDVLSTSGLVNYFGKLTQLEDIKLKPLLLRKGNTLLALYGLGWVRDRRLHYLYRERKVCMARPVENTDDWFNLLVVHQNRNRHTATDYLPEEFLPDFVDLVVWGHEHECLIDPEWNGRYHVTQPGSSVATSLCPGEAVKKHVGILEIYFDGKKQHRMTKIPLKTVRPFVIKDVSLFDMTGQRERAQEEEKATAEAEFCAVHVEEMIERSCLQLSGDPRQPTLPLVRLRVEYGDKHETFSFHHFARLFHEKVANPRSIVIFHKVKGKSKNSKEVGLDVEQLRRVMQPELVPQACVVDLVREYFETVDDSMQLSLLSNVAMQRAVSLFVDKQCKEAVREMIAMQEERALRLLMERVSDVDNVTEETLDAEIDGLRNIVSVDKDVEDVDRVADRILTCAGNQDVAGNGDEFDEEFAGTRRTARGRGRGRSKAVNKSVSKRSVSGYEEEEEEEEPEIEDEDEVQFSFADLRRGRGSPSRGRATTTRRAARGAARRASSTGRGRKRGVNL